MSNLDRERFDIVGVSLAGPFGTELEDATAHAQLTIHYLGKHWGPDVRMYPRLHAVLSRLRPTILHTHVHVLRYVLPYMLYRRTPVMVHTVHSLAEFEVERRSQWIQRVAFAAGTVPVAVAGEVAASMLRVYGLRDTRVVPNSLPVQKYRAPRVGRLQWRAKEGFEPEDILLVCVAGLRAEKNHAGLLEAFHRGPARCHRARLLLAGDGAERPRLEAQVRSLGLEKQVVFLSLRSDIPDLLAACDLFVLSSRYEGQPLALMEAMASGLPIVSTRVGGVPELVRDGREGFLTPPGDWSRMAEAMVWLVDNPALRRTMGAAGARRAIAHFDVSSMAASYAEIYTSLLHRRASGRNGMAVSRN